MDPLEQSRLRLISFPWLLALILILFAAAAMVLAFGWGAHAREWLSLTVRWLHIIYGIAWIGASFYFIFLENALERDGDTMRDDIAGNIYSIHGGGIYYLEKYKTAPKPFPKTLHWFKWDAYLTWTTGFLLLIIVYYSHPQVTLLPPGSELSALAAIAIGVGSLVMAWLVYVGLSKTRLLYNAPLFALVGLGLITVAAFLLTQVFSGRGAFIHVGAMLGGLMAGNVLFVIMPSQRALVTAVQRGETLDLDFIKWVQLRSRHNNYLTLPVLFTMISNHYPITYGHGLNWLILILLFIASVAVRHSVNVTEKEHHRTLTEGGALPYLLVAAAAIMIGALYLTAPKDTVLAAPENVERVAFSEVHPVITERCASCHAGVPTQAGFSAPPAGVMLETPEQIAALATKIKQVAVDSEYMPPGNLTSITEVERALIGSWIVQGAEVE